MLWFHYSLVTHLLIRIDAVNVFIYICHGKLKLFSANDLVTSAKKQQ